jgi:hypothetical protein
MNGLRNKNDGQTFFGILNEKDYTNTYYNDYIINISNHEQNNQSTSSTGRIFNIYYSKITNDYFLHLMNSNYNINYLIENKYYFSNNNKDVFIIIGKCLLTINQKEKTNNKKFINIKVDYEDNRENNYEFNEDDTPITIGRNIENKIFINNNSISKKHGIIMFSKENKNFYYQDLKSTNGSILYMREDDTLKIKGEMRCKLNDIIFKILEIP